LGDICHAENFRETLRSSVPRVAHVALDSFMDTSVTAKLHAAQARLNKL
jgi:hypothetical protein